jgi:hypothetical protein
MSKTAACFSFKSSHHEAAHYVKENIIAVLKAALLV